MSVTLLNELGAVHWNVKVVTLDTAAFGPLCVISTRPLLEFVAVVVAAESDPPVAKSPAGADTFRPPFSCMAGLSMVSV